MCLLLLFVSASAEPGKYRLILATNRDEYMERPAKPADFWERNGEILAGVDLTPGKEGGTWMGVSRGGRVGVLLNASSGTSDPQKLGRGFIVSDYLSNPDATIEHLTHLQAQASAYNPFHLVTVDLTDTVHPLRHFCNIDPKITEFNTGFHAFCNSSLEHPYQKAIAGREKLASVVEQFGQSTETKEELVENILKLLQDQHRYYPDPVIDALSTIDPKMKAPLSSICVRPSNVNYGTRTHTIVLVDDQGVVDFYEWTLKVPVINGKLDLIKSVHQFKIK